MEMAEGSFMGGMARSTVHCRKVTLWRDNEQKKRRFHILRIKADSLN